MTNLSVNLVLIPLAALTIFVTAMSFFHVRSQAGMKSFIFSGAMCSLWLLSDIFFYLTTNIDLSIFLYNIKIGFIGFISLGLICFSIHTCHMSSTLTARRRFALFLIPAITALLAATGRWHPLIRKHLAIVQTEPLKEIRNTYGVWFWVHTAYAYGMILLSIVFLLRYRKEQPKEYRRPTTFIVCAYVLVALLNFLTVLLWAEAPLDGSLLSSSLSLIFIYIAVLHNSRVNYLVLARDEIYNLIDDYVFVLSPEGDLLDANHSAKDFLDRLGIPLQGQRFDDLLFILHTRGGITKEAVKGEQGKDLYLPLPEGEVIFHMRRKPVYSNNRKLGEIATFSDVTHNRKLITELATTAENDALTGLQNRRGYDKTLLQLSDQDSLPLSIILGDVNGLKAVNDRLGHNQGDKLLQVAAAILEQACPPGGCVFRIGGDEFVLLLPRCTEQEARCIITDIRHRADSETRFPFHLSIALGCATRTRVQENLNRLIHQADMDMYRNKQTSKVHLKEII